MPCIVYTLKNKLFSKNPYIVMLGLKSNVNVFFHDIGMAMSTDEPIINRKYGRIINSLADFNEPYIREDHRILLHQLVATPTAMESKNMIIYFVQTLTAVAPEMVDLEHDLRVHISPKMNTSETPYDEQYFSSLEAFYQVYGLNHPNYPATV